MDIDEELIARARAGDASAMEELLTAIRPRVVSRCARLLPHTLDAEEAAQDALLSIATHLRDYSGTGSFMGWVTVIASNSARQTYRTLKRRFAERSVDEMPVSPDPRTTSVIAGSRSTCSTRSRRWSRRTRRRPRRSCCATSARCRTTRSPP